MARRYLVRPLPVPGTGALPPDVAHHVGRVMRARVGETITLFDGAGREVEARVVATGRKEITVDVGAAREVRREPACRVELAVALPKGPRADWLFEHGTEVGVAVFRPVSFERSPRTPRTLDRWRRIVAAAAGQCDRSHLPEVHEAVTLPDLLADPGLPELRYVAAPGAAVELGTSHGNRAVVAVGPEGGLAPDEVEALAAAGFAPRALGPLTLRVETAALVAAVRLLSGGDRHEGSGCSHSSANEK